MLSCSYGNGLPLEISIFIIIIAHDLDYPKKLKRDPTV